ncbi:uncharacterized protein H6S33_010041 [Morchella sextelata]|uniref:uncharacterized protein n=1 Tax=Morchella sextelata TaxID=1174677 RepID=UPI001D0475C4|nr:uncharacterized protein H6S33_010041 [Morchella sextelata]KAH0611989.1 hypothetical protein H6S33_010041 [Morchella sextelata]
MGWWKSLQDTFHPPPPRRARPPGFVPPPPPTEVPLDPISDLESSKLSWPSTPRRPPFAGRRTFTRILISMTVFMFLVIIFSVGGASPSRPPTISSDNAEESFSPNLTPPPPRPETFPFLKNYYKGLFSLANSDMNVPEYPPRLAHERELVLGSSRPDAVTGGGKTAGSRAFSPYPKYDHDEYRRTWEGEYKECSFDEDENSGETRGRPEIRVFDGAPEGMPAPIFGSHRLLGINDDVCYDRYGRYGTYGYGYEDFKGGLGEAVYDGGDNETDIETGWGPGKMPFKRIDWRGVDWGTLQKSCYEKNKGRFENVETKDTLYPSEDYMAVNVVEDREHSTLKARGMPGGGFHKQKKHVPRTAVLVRTWTGYQYSAGDIAFLRSLISELSINTGGEYSIHLLVHSKDNKVPIWSDNEVYRQVLQENVPEEFWGIAELWNEAMMGSIYARMDPWKYRELPLHGVYRSTFMPVQWFAHRHQEYEFFWNLEVDARYTGHWYQFFEQISSWAKKQPRKHLWERNERFYIPEVHGSYANFSETISKTIPKNSSIWGPPQVETVTIHPDDPVPPFATAEEDVNAEWGVGEDADLLTMNPIFDPEGTDWGLSPDTTGYGTYTEASYRYNQDPRKDRLKEPSPPPPGTPTGPPRRTAIVAISRLSRRLLNRMHWENAVQGHTMFSEMWPASCAFQHGLKAVFVPHPTYIDRQWPAEHLEKTFNMGVYGGQTVFGEANQYNFLGSTWFYVSGFPAVLWTRWLGGEAHNDGGEAWDRERGRMCLKGVFMHPIKGL